MRPAPPAIVRAVEWLVVHLKLPFLPALPFRTWMAICGITFAVSLANAAGGLLGFWTSSNDVANAAVLVFILLAVTPLYFPPRVVFVAFRLDSETIGWVEINEGDAWVLHREPNWRVRRLVVQNGKVIEDHALETKET